ncbi:MAG: FTR1 family protein [Porticoccaceae bacterium]|nr:FTR1 family protein [Porticoccaceae bacterium]
MFSSMIIVFREVLEAALVIGIVCAATRGVRYRGATVMSGIFVGVLGAAIIAWFADSLADLAEGMGQELFNAMVLLVVVVMLAWHTIWMSHHGAQMTQEATQTGESVKQGAEPLTVLFVLVGLAVLREGAEVVLFLYGIAASGSAADMMALGSGLGLLMGLLAGFTLYAGLVRIPTRHLFTVTTFMLVLLAAGMAGQASKYLIQADYLPALGYDIWDSSWLVANGSIAGEILRTLIGYDARPAGLQLLFYVVTLGFILFCMWWVKARDKTSAEQCEPLA